MKRVAVWLYGGIGTGSFSQGQPVLDKLVRELTKDFEIVVYSQSLVNKDYQPKGFKLRFPSENINNGILRWMVLCYYFLNDHTRKKYNSIWALWGFPGGFLATLLGKIHGLPVVVSLQGGDSVGIKSIRYGVMLSLLYRTLAKWTYRRASVLTTLTSFQRDIISGYGVSRDIRVIPLGADVQMFHPSDVRAGLRAPCHFLHVSNFNPIKDPESLLRAFAIVSSRHPSLLRIIGGQYEHSNVSLLCKELKIEKQVEVLGPVIYSEISAHMQWADLMIHPSLYEGQGIVVAEAAASGVVITGTPVGLIADLGEEAAIIGPIGDYRTLAEKILAVLDHPDEFEKRRRNALDWAVHHDFEWTVGQFKKILNEF